MNSEKSKKSLEENPTIEKSKDGVIVNEHFSDFSKADEYEDVKEELANVISSESLTVEKKVDLALAISSYSFSGPLPHPELLRRYNETLPGAAERIFKLAESQAAHRQDMERTIIRSGANQTKMGQWFAFVLSIMALCFSFYLAIENHTVVASVIGGSTILGLASIFIIGKIKKDKEESIPNEDAD